ncbi:MAG: hypothetical protein IJW99_11680, partial [Clostridia bacterium]|nr:hypothetical protein [Clostridia bacterium]
QIADKYIRQLNDFYDDISVESYVIMPNHIHIMLWVKARETDRRGRRSLQYRIPFRRGSYLRSNDFVTHNLVFKFLEHQ